MSQYGEMLRAAKAEADKEKQAERRAARKREKKRRAYREKYYPVYMANKQKKKIKVAGRDRPSSCELCGRNDRRICFDHCHTTGKFRGWLCHTCNFALGLSEDNATLLRRMADYVEGKLNIGCGMGAPQKIENL